MPESISRGEPVVDGQIPLGARVIQDGEAIRILGGWIGYKVDVAAIWEKRVSDMESDALRWMKRRPTLVGRVIISNYIVLSKAQYLLMTNEPPPSVVDRITRAVRKLMWTGRAKSILTLEEVGKPIEEGGLNLPDFKARLEAARMVWIKKWRTPSGSPPAWAPILDRLVAHAAKGGYDPLMTSLYDQTWRETMGWKSKLSLTIRNMLSTGRKAGLIVDAPRFAPNTKLTIHMWLSRFVDVDKRFESTMAARTLRQVHQVRSQRDLVRKVLPQDNTCPKHHLCLKARARLLEAVNQPLSMLVTTPRKPGTIAKDNLDLTPVRKRANKKAKKEGQPILLDPNVTHDGSLSDATRVFVEGGPTRPNELEVVRGLERRKPWEALDDPIYQGNPPDIVARCCVRA